MITFFLYEVIYMVDKKTRVLTILLAINMVVTMGIIGFMVHCKCNQPSITDTKMDDSSKYTVYIGTNDKDTYSKVMPLEQAKKIVNEICMDHVGGYTVNLAAGGWVDEKGVETMEDSLVYTFCDISEEQLTAILDDVLEELNQNSILVEHQQVETTYYTSK